MLKKSLALQYGEHTIAEQNYFLKTINKRVTDL